MRGSRRTLTLSAVLMCVAGAADRPAAWTSATDERVVREALRLMPSSLKGILQNHLDTLVAGAREAAGEEPSALHGFDAGQKNPSAVSRLEELVPKAVAAIDQHKPFADVARLLGRIAHYAGDLNNPLQVSGDDPAEDRYAARYTVYVEEHLPRYPLVFYGWDDPALDAAKNAREGVRAFAESSAQQARPSYGAIRTAYDPASKVPMARRFDERSLPFGVGSLGWSHTVTDTARLWRFVWKHARGDMRGTPYPEKAAAGVSGAKP